MSKYTKVQADGPALRDKSGIAHQYAEPYHLSFMGNRTAFGYLVTCYETLCDDDITHNAKVT